MKSRIETINKISKAIKNHAEKGFSLLEVAIVLGIVGVVSAGTVAVYSEQKTHAEWQQSDAKLDLIKKSLVHFARENKYLPCPSQTLNGDDGRVDDQGDIPAIPAIPATPAVPSTATAPAIPAIPATPAQAAQPNTPVQTCPVLVGFVPFDDLGLSMADATDSWGNPIRYAINQGTNDADRMLTCPLDSACYFSNRQAPAFNLNTPPVFGDAGTNNLRVCDGNKTATCSDTTATDDLVADNVIVVLVAYNENGDTAPVPNTAEAENADNDRFYVVSQYAEAPFYDDLIRVISANDIKESHESQVVLTNSSDDDGSEENDDASGVLTIAGGTGDNDRFSQNIGINIESQTISMGAENAGKQVTLTLDAVITGDWEDAGVNGGTPEVNADDVLETQDRFLIGINGPSVSDMDDTLANLVDSVARFDSHTTTESFFYDAGLDDDDTWYEKITINTVLDENGELNIDFTVLSTQVEEQVQVSNIVATVYNAPGGVPNMPYASVDYDSDGNMDTFGYYSGTTITSP